MNLKLVSNRYRFVRTLGKGGFGETFLVEDTQLPSGRYCVLKQLTPIENNSQIYQLVQERFQREAATLEELGESSNGQIPRLYAYFSEADKFYLVQEYIEGETLLQKLQTQGPLSETAVREILVGILPVLEYVHRRRMVHRDIKPDNTILRSSNFKPVLIDFGAVKETMGTMINAQGNSTRSIVIGTPGYMPSEQAAGRPIYASDLYSLGLTAIYLLTGKHPQTFPTEPLTGQVQWRSFALRVSPSFANVLDKAIMPNASDRYQTAQQMLNALISNPVSSIPSAVPVAPPTSTPTPIPAPTPAVYPNGYPNGHSNGYSNGFPNGYPNGYQPAPGHSPVYGYPVGNGYAPQSPPSVPTPHPVPVSPTPAPKGMSDWSKAMIMGSLIGGFILAAVFIITQSQQASTPQVTTDLPSISPPSPSPVPSVTPSPSPAPSVMPSLGTDEGFDLPQVSPQPPVRVPSQSSIDQQDAVALVNAWLQAKRVMLAPPYDESVAQRIATGLLLEDLTKTNGSIDWLRDNNARYQFGVQKIDSVEQLVGNGTQATVEMWVTEDRTLYVNGQVSSSETDFKTRLISYSLEQVGGRWKIADYKILRER